MLNVVDKNRAPFVLVPQTASTVTSSGTVSLTTMSCNSYTTCSDCTNSDMCEWCHGNVNNGLCRETTDYKCPMTTPISVYEQSQCVANIGSPEPGDSMTIYYIIAAVAVVCCILIVIVVVVVLTKRKSTSNQSQSSPTPLNNTSTNEYAAVSFSQNRNSDMNLSSSEYQDVQAIVEKARYAAVPSDFSQQQPQHYASVDPI
mmetsp:Transcript_13558/g.23472  ORF Transcript_13558/g.23472 Transcript_13558/m.23472 type:complete len:201 (+) Transcript_13558:1-603(+)